MYVRVHVNRSESKHFFFLFDLLWFIEAQLTFFLEDVFALFAFVLAAELHNGNGEKDYQDTKAHSDPDCCWVYSASCKIQR